MDDFTLFYAWQSDTDAKINRFLIRDAAKKALNQLVTDSVLEESPRLDSDTQNVGGTPEIASTIFSKIDKAGLFLADVTFIGKSDDNDSLPNSNVLLELGYAAARIGWPRTILVMNTAFGPPENLLFDLRHRRWPITYHLELNLNEVIKEQKKKLVVEFKNAIQAAAQEEHAATLNAISRLDSNCLQWMTTLGNEDWFTPPPRKTYAEVWGNQAVDNALIRLLEIGILRCDVNPTEGKYAYHWTYFGKLVLYYLELRQPQK